MEIQNPTNDSSIIHENLDIFKDFLKTHFSSETPTDINWNNDFGQAWSNGAEPFWNDPGGDGPDAD